MRMRGGTANFFFTTIINEDQQRIDELYVCPLNHRLRNPRDSLLEVVDSFENVNQLRCRRYPHPHLASSVDSQRSLFSSMDRSDTFPAKKLSYSYADGRSRDSQTISEFVRAIRSWMKIWGTLDVSFAWNNRDIRFTSELIGWHLMSLSLSLDRNLESRLKAIFFHFYG